MQPGNHSTDNARSAISGVLAGNPPNGIAPADCGEWQETVSAVFDGYTGGGTEGARRVWATIAKANPGAARLVADDGAGWGPVLPFHSPDLPEFPLDAFPDWLREYCEAVTETMQTPPDLAGMVALSVLSAACGGRVEVRIKEGWEEPVNVFTVVGLPPGTGKSPVFRAMTAPVVMFERQQLEKSEQEIASAQMRRDVLEARIRDAKAKAAKQQGENALRQAYAEIDEMIAELNALIVPARPKYIVDDITPEAVASTLADQGGRLAVLSSEGDIFSIMAGRYSSGAPNIGVYKKGHAGDEIRVDRKTRSEIIARPALTMGITTQPEVMRQFGQNSTFRSEGLLARFFYALPKSNVGSRRPDTDPIPEETRNTYYFRLLNLLENVNSGNSGNSGNRIGGADQVNSGNSEKNIYKDDSRYIYYLEISEAGKKLFLQFKAWVEPQLGPYGAMHHMSDWANKLPGGVLRVAGLLHMATVGVYAPHNSHNSQNTIDEATIARAIRFANYFIPHAQAAYAEIGADPSVEGARLVLRWVEKFDVRQFTKRQCYQGVKGTLKRADDLDPVLTLLCDHGYLREVETADRGGPGRKPSAIYDVNPIVFDAPHNSHNSHNSVEAPGATFTPPPTDDDAPTWRSVEGY